MSDDVPELYYTRDFPVLKVIARWEAAGRPEGHLRPEAISTAIGLSVEEVNQSLSRLVRGGLVDAASTIDQGEYFMVRKLTGAGLRESGVWGREEDVASGIRIVLEQEIKSAESDEKRALLQQILSAAVELGSKVLTRLGTELLKGLPH